MTAPAPSHAVRAVVVFDRDGTLNELALDEWTGRYESPYAASDVRLIDGVAEGLSRLDELGVACFVASNQPAAAKGRTTLRNLAAVHQAVDSLLRASGPAPRGLSAEFLARQGFQSIPGGIHSVTEMP